MSSTKTDSILRRIFLLYERIPQDTTLFLSGNSSTHFISCESFLNWLSNSWNTKKWNRETEDQRKETIGVIFLLALLDTPGAALEEFHILFQCPSFNSERREAIKNLFLQIIRSGLKGRNQLRKSTSGISLLKPLLGQDDGLYWDLFVVIISLLLQVTAEDFAGEAGYIINVRHSEQDCLTPRKTFGRKSILAGLDAKRPDNRQSIMQNQRNTVDTSLENYSPQFDTPSRHQASFTFSSPAKPLSNFRVSLEPRPHDLKGIHSSGFQKFPNRTPKKESPPNSLLDSIGALDRVVSPLSDDALFSEGPDEKITTERNLKEMEFDTVPGKVYPEIVPDSAASTNKNINVIPVEDSKNNSKNLSSALRRVTRAFGKSQISLSKQIENSHNSPTLENLKPVRVNKIAEKSVIELNQRSINDLDTFSKGISSYLKDVCSQNLESYEQLLSVSLESAKPFISNLMAEKYDLDSAFPMIFVDFSGKGNSSVDVLLKYYFLEYLHDSFESPKNLQSRIKQLQNKFMLSTNQLMGKLSRLNIKGMIMRTYYSSSRITHSIKNSRIYWGNILSVKGFRPPEVARLDTAILQEFFHYYKRYAFTIAEKAADRFSNPKKNRTLLTLSDDTLLNTPVIQEIYYSILFALAEFKSSSPQQPVGYDATSSAFGISHEIENFAFLFSVKNGMEQMPHLDYDYSLKEKIQLGNSFFHPEMSYSFIYCLQDDTMLHFLNPDDDLQKMTLHFDRGDLVIWSGQQVHFGAKYRDKDNLRLFGNIRSTGFEKKENEFYWYNVNKRQVEVLSSSNRNDG